MRTFDVDFRDEGLPAKAPHVKVTGWHGSLVWPDLCPYCGAPAFERMAVRRVSRRHSRQAPRRSFTTRIKIPFCARCLAHHRQMVEPPRRFQIFQVPRETEITRACVFTRNLGNIFVGWRRIFAIRDAAFAKAFEAANRHRLWTEAVQKRDRRRTLVVSALVHCESCHQLADLARLTLLTCSRECKPVLMLAFLAMAVAAPAVGIRSLVRMKRARKALRDSLRNKGRVHCRRDARAARELESRRDDHPIAL